MANSTSRIHGRSIAVSVFFLTSVSPITIELVLLIIILCYAKEISHWFLDAWFESVPHCLREQTTMPVISPKPCSPAFSVSLAWVISVKIQWRDAFLIFLACLYYKRRCKTIKRVIVIFTRTQSLSSYIYHVILYPLSRTTWRRFNLRDFMGWDRCVSPFSDRKSVV